MVYVDQPQHNLGNMIMCHMVADTHEELIQMADKIGVQRKWIQNEGTYREHFDVCKSKRQLALRFGAKEISHRELVRLATRKRESTWQF